MDKKVKQRGKKPVRKTSKRGVGLLGPCVLAVLAVCAGLFAVAPDNAGKVQHVRALAEKLVAKVLNTWRRASGDGTVKVTVFGNGESDGGLPTVLTQVEHGALSEIGVALSPMKDCGLVIDRHGPEDPGFCKVFNGAGVRVRTLSELVDGDRLYLVPNDRLFVFPTMEVGFKLELPHVESPLGKTIVMQTLATSPRVFQLHNFMSEAEADQVIADALAIDDEAHMLKRSSTGTKGGAVSRTRTSDNAFLTASESAMKLKHRIFKLLGIEKYKETWADGLQVLRYNVSQAYVAHLDYLEADPSSPHDFDSGGSGINRFATVLLYFTEPEEGGETVFVQASPLEGEKLSVDAALAKIRETEGAHLESIGIKRGSWEERLMAQCRSRLAFKPKKGSAVLFYSQHPDGKVDNASEHGACPVISGQKWAANLWVWNGPRYGYTKRDPRTGKMIESGLGDNYKVLATFLNEDVEGAVLYYQDQLWAELDIGEASTANSYVGHDWNVRVDGQIVQEFSITEYVPEQTFLIRAEQLQPPLDPAKLAYA